MAPLIKVKENINSKQFWIAVLVELTATCALVFIGCGSILIHFPDPVLETSDDIIRVSLTFGLVVTIIIAALGPASDCHVNPAVSIGLVFAGKTSLVRAFFYVIVQIIGALLGSSLLYFIVPDEEQRHNLGLTKLANGVSPVQGFFSEAAMTFMLLIVISSCVDEGRSDFNSFKSTNPLIIGFTITALTLKGSSYTGASLNPARSFGPAFLTWNWTDHWVYWLGPITGGILGALAYRFLLTTHEPVASEFETESEEFNEPSSAVPPVSGVLVLPPVVPLKHYYNKQTNNNKNRLLLPRVSIESGSSSSSGESVQTKTSTISTTSKASKTSTASAYSLALAPTPFDL